jgi:hypothetical protein
VIGSTIIMTYENENHSLRDLIQQMSRDNPLWGAPRIHGELLMLGFEIAQLTVSKYMVRSRKPPSRRSPEPKDAMTAAAKIKTAQRCSFASFTGSSRRQMASVGP